jgi:hypothetical protein
LPVTVQEDEDRVVGSERLAFILLAETILAVRRSRWRAFLVEGELQSTAPWRGAPTVASGTHREEEKDGNRKRGSGGGAGEEVDGRG